MSSSSDEYSESGSDSSYDDSSASGSGSDSYDGSSSDEASSTPPRPGHLQDTIKPQAYFRITHMALFSGLKEAQKNGSASASDLKALLAALSQHGLQEDKEFFPYVKQYSKKGAAVIAKASKQHHDLEALDSQVEDATKNGGKASAKLIKKWVKAWSAHLTYEEKNLVPIAMTIPPEKSGPVVKRALKVHKIQVGIWIIRRLPPGAQQSYVRVLLDNNVAVGLKTITALRKTDEDIAARVLANPYVAETLKSKGGCGCTLL